MNYSQNLKSVLRSIDPKDKEMVRRVNQQLIAMKAASGTTHNNQTLSNVSIQYKNADYIGLELMPVVNVAKKSDDYIVYSKRDRLAGPDDQMSKRSRPNEINESRTTQTFACKDYALMNYVDNETLREQDAPLDEKVDLIEAINDVLALKREQRIASILTTPGNYGGNTAVLSGTDQWDNASNTNILAKLQDGMAATWTGAGPGELVGFTSLDVWNVISRHPSVRGLFSYVKDGFATTDMLARYLGLSKIVVGAARQDIANEGQTASYSRIWGKFFGVIRVASSPSRRNASFGYTFRLQGDPKTDLWFDAAVGKTGGWYGRVGFSEDYKVVAPDTGFLYSAVIA